MNILLIILDIIINGKILTEFNYHIDLKEENNIFLDFEII